MEINGVTLILIVAVVGIGFFCYHGWVQRQALEAELARLSAANQQLKTTAILAAVAGVILLGALLFVMNGKPERMPEPPRRAALNT